MRLAERQAAITSKMEKLSLEQQKKMAEAKEKVEESKKRKFEQNSKKLLDGQAERERLNGIFNQEMSKLKKQKPLYLIKEQEFAI